MTRSPAKAHVLPVAPLPPRRKRKPERETAVYVYGARHPEQPTCWLAAFSDQPCAGPLEHAHLIEQQTLKREGLGRYLGDAAVWEWACRRHHFGFDSRLRVFVPRTALSEETERFAAAHGLTDYLDRRYGEREPIAAVLRVEESSTDG
ncbi:MAG TPA: hypothetical protein VMB51_05320 [Solirubrobacteraceae bacterium]|nr:hypothetical protein [Solirubrobacteraceae bacterium]